MANSKNTKKQLFEMVAKLDPKFKLNEGYDISAYEEDPNLYAVKVEKLKASIDQLFDEQEYDVIDTLYRLMVERKPKFTQAVKQISEDLDYGSVPKFTTAEKLIRSAERDGYLKGMESSAQYIMDAAREIGNEWDKLHPEQRRVFRDTFYNNFLKKIGKR